MGDFYGIHSFAESDPKAFERALGVHKEVRFGHPITLDEYDRIERNAPQLIGLRRGPDGGIWHVIDEASQGFRKVITDEERARWSGVSGEVAEQLNKGMIRPATPAEMVSVCLSPEYEISVLLDRLPGKKADFDVKDNCGLRYNRCFMGRNNRPVLSQPGGPEWQQIPLGEREALVLDAVRSTAVARGAPIGEIRINDYARSAIREGCDGLGCSSERTAEILEEFEKIANEVYNDPATMWGESADLDSRPWEFYEEVLSLSHSRHGEKVRLCELAERAGSPDWLMTVLARQPVRDAADAALAFRIAANGVARDEASMSLSEYASGDSVSVPGGAEFDMEELAKLIADEKHRITPHRGVSF